ncbi:MAG: DUF2723 domain-containing protein [Candidatus Aegiribacteria sp.]|nr:DUF2723 domain-containing protein [Candidatus Aegiribacteria sp.]
MIPNLCRTNQRLFLSLFCFLILFFIAFITGQKGIPPEDGGEFLTVARLGGVNHPPGLPLLSLSSRLSWILFGKEGLKVLFALAAASALLLIMKKQSIALLLFLAGILLLPAVTGRILIWDAYGPLFFIFALTLYRKPTFNFEGGYLMGFAMAIHPQGIFLPVLFRWKNVSILKFACGLLLGLSIYLALPVFSASGAIVDWGNTGSVGNFIRQVTAGDYREVYGSSMGGISVDVLLRHLGAMWRIVWPVLLLPIVIGMVRLFGTNRKLMIKLEILIVADLLFVTLINPMAAGTSQTAVVSLFAIVVISMIGISALEKVRKSVGLIAAGAVLTAGVMLWNPLPDQENEIKDYFAPAPYESVFFLRNNDLLYGGWVLKYVEDRRPDIVLLSTENFSGWFENMVVWFNPDIDLSRGVSDVGDYSMSCEEVAGLLIDATIQDNPGRKFLGDL